MTTYTISSDNNITAFPTPEAAQDTLALGAMLFTSQKDLAKLANDWPASRFIEIWNSFAGVAPFDDLKPVKKFTDRKTAVTRIWQAIQKLAPVAQEGAPEVPLAATASKEPKKQKGAPKAKKGATEAKPEARDGSKKAKVIDMLTREKGATNEEIQKATDWQAHSIRGFISGNLVKKMGLKVETIERENGARAYHLA